MKKRPYCDTVIQVIIVDITIIYILLQWSVVIALEMTNKHRVMDNPATSSAVRLVQW